MTIDRRDFIAGAALVAVSPALEFLPPQLSRLETSLSHPVFMIDGWNARNTSDAIDQVWIKLDRSWRTAWR